MNYITLTRERIETTGSFPHFTGHYRTYHVGRLKAYLFGVRIPLWLANYLLGEIQS